MRGLIALHALGELLAREALGRTSTPGYAESWLRDWEDTISSLSRPDNMGAVDVGEKLAALVRTLHEQVKGR